MRHKLFFISGLPRTGSTLLSTILAQNPRVHTEGNSALCQLMWDMQCSVDGPSAESLSAGLRLPHTATDIISALPDLYYKEVEKEIVFDKGRTWTLYANHQLLKRYVDASPKIIVLVRPIGEVIQSFAKLRLQNGWEGDVFTDLLVPNTDPVLRPFDGICYAKFIKSSDFLFVTYKTLVQNPERALHAIYDHCGLDWFEHRFDRIEQSFKEDDTVHGLKGMHDVRPTIEVADNFVTLPDNIQKVCDELTDMLFDGLNAV